MNYQSIFYLLAIATLVAGHGHHHHHHHHHNHHDHYDDHVRHLKKNEKSKCGTREPRQRDSAAANAALKNYRADAKRRSGFTVPVCFHVLYGTDGSASVKAPSTEKLQASMDALNRAYSSSSCCDPFQTWCDLGSCSVETGFSFEFAEMDGGCDVDHVPQTLGTDVTANNVCVTYTNNSDWASSTMDDLPVKSALRKGGPSVLNIYWVRFSNGVLGYATFPWEANNSIEDGVVNCNNCLPGDTGTDFNEGDTLVHEVGHWLGLFHTFQGGCDSGFSIGDGISDTAAEARPYLGCDPVRRPNTCTDNQGPDPIFNFMDYSDDLCLYEFTPKQVEKMMASYQMYRIDEDFSDIEVWVPEDLDLGTAVLDIDLLEDESRLFVVRTNDCDLTCRISGGTGDMDLYVSENVSPSSLDDFNCGPFLEGNDEECVVQDFRVNDSDEEDFVGASAGVETNLFGNTCANIAGMFFGDRDTTEDPIVDLNEFCPGRPVDGPDHYCTSGQENIIYVLVNAYTDSTGVTLECSLNN